MEAGKRSKVEEYWWGIWVFLGASDLDPRYGKISEIKPAEAMECGTFTKGEIHMLIWLSKEIGADMYYAKKERLETSGEVTAFRKRLEMKLVKIVKNPW